MAIKLIVPDATPHFLLALSILCLWCFVVGFALAVPARIKCFTKDRLSMFNKEHKDAGLGETPSRLGFPDAGNGRYSRVLSYAAWLDFNNTQRAHLNLTEQLPLTITFFFAALLLMPGYVKYMIWVYVFGRVTYTIGYKFGGGAMRLPGATLATPQTHLMTLAFPAILCYKVAQLYL